MALFIIEKYILIKYLEFMKQLNQDIQIMIPKN